jgi:hypothetical protein
MVYWITKNECPNCQCLYHISDELKERIKSELTIEPSNGWPRPDNDWMIGLVKIGEGGGSYRMKCYVCGYEANEKNLKKGIWSRKVKKSSINYGKLKQRKRF